MGCCCAKEQDDSDVSERSRLLGSTDTNQKSRFLDSSMPANSNGMSGLANANYIGSNALNSTGSNSSLNGNIQQNNLNGTGSNGQTESNQMFEKILSEVIHVSAFEQRAHTMDNDFSNLQPVTDMAFKIKGLLEPAKQNLALPEGVTAPVTVLSAQPPFSSDIRLINQIAHDAQLCINNFTLQVPDNVTYNFNPIA